MFRLSCRYLRARQSRRKVCNFGRTRRCTRPLKAPFNSSSHRQFIAALLAAGELVVRLLARGLVAIILSCVFVVSAKFACRSSLASASTCRRFRLFARRCFVGHFCFRCSLVLSARLPASTCARFSSFRVAFSGQRFACSVPFAARRGNASRAGCICALRLRRSCKYLVARVLVSAAFAGRRLFVVYVRVLASKARRESHQQASEQGAAPDRLQLRSFRSQAPFTLSASGGG